MKILRRRFLALSGGFLAAPVVARAGAGTPSLGGRAAGRVIVVGAGIAGLTAALELVRRGVEVVLLERATREGGRFESVLFDGVAANLGVQWVNPGVSPLVDGFLERIPSQVLGARGAGFALAWDGKLVDPGGADFFAALPVSARARKDLAASVGKMRRDAAALYPGVDLDRERNWNHVFDLPTDTPLWRELESTSMARYLAGFDPAVTTVWGTRVGAGFGGTPETISALFLVGWYRGNPFFPVHILKGGNHRLTEAMAAAFEAGGRRIRYGAEVISVAQDAPGVTATCADGSVHVADRCIVATTAPVARRIVRGLSPVQAAALEAVEYVPLTSIALHVRNFPGPERLAGALYVNGSTAAFVNQAGPVVGNPREGTVLVVVVTDPARTGAPERELLAMAERDLRVVQPGFDLRRDLVGHAVKEFRIGEVHVKPGFLSRHLSALRAPAGRVHFGGEFVSCFPTWGGAVWGGQQAAAAAARELRGGTRE